MLLYTSTYKLKMIILKIMYPLTRQLRHAAFIECNLISTYMCNRGKHSKSNTLVNSKRTEVDTNVKPIGEKVKETTQTVSYLGVILLGIGITGTLGYAIFRELFSSKSPNNVYNKAVKKCLSDTRVEDKLGLPITAFGEESRRGRRQHVSHALHEKDGRKHLRMKFYLKGSCNRGTVYLEMVEVGIYH